MKKKLLAVLICMSMAVTMLAGCGGKTEGETTPTPNPTATSKPTATPKPTEAPTPTPVAAETLPDAFAHLTFDGENEGYSAVTQVSELGNLTGATYGLAPADVTYAYANGPVGNALYIDGTYGLDLNLKPTNTDTYTVSFWMNADRLATYGASLQMGYNMGMAADVGNNVTWFNVTQAEWGESSAKIFPIVWSRNEASDAADGTDCWPWMYSFDNAIHGKREWVMVTIVCTGEKQDSSLGSTTAGAQFYVNGVLTYDSQDNYLNSSYFEYTWDASLAPNIMKPGDSEFESYFGINYWDTVFKGYVDDLYVFDTALTPGQVTSLYQLGDPTVESKVDASISGPEEAEPVAQTVTTFADNAIATVGVPTCDNGFWTSFTDGYELADGATVTLHFNNYGSGLNNWSNYVLALANTKTTADLAPSADNYAGYAEYGVYRADAFGWAYSTDPVYEFSWDWANFLDIMKDADVTMKLTRNGGIVSVDAKVVDANFEEYTYKITATTTAAAADPMYVFLTGEASYIELLSVQTVVVNPDAIATMGSVALDNGFWTSFTDGYELADGKTMTMHFKNYGAGANNWENYVVAFANTKTTADLAPSADNYPGYAEYGVFRADSYGWGFVNAAYEQSWEWDNFTKIFLNADVTLKFTRTAGNVVVDGVIIGSDGLEYTYKVTAETTAGTDPMYVFLTGEKCYVEMLSVE